MNALIDAVRARDIEEVIRLIGERANIATLNNDGRDAMFYAEQIVLGIPRGIITNLLETSPYVDLLEQEFDEAFEGERPADYNELKDTLRRTVYQTASEEEEPGTMAFVLYYKVEDIARRTREEILEHGGQVNVANRTGLLAAIENAQELGDFMEFIPGFNRLDQLRNEPPPPPPPVAVVANNNHHGNAPVNIEGAQIAQAEAEFNAIQAEHEAQIQAGINEAQIGNIPRGNGNANNANNANNEDPNAPEFYPNTDPTMGGRRRRKSRKQKKLKKSRRVKKQRRGTRRK